MTDLIAIRSRLKEAIENNAIEVRINEPPQRTTSRVVIDVEHDEFGEFVGIGVLFVGIRPVYYFSDTSLLRASLNCHNEIVGHNVVTDVELMQQWGFNVSPSQIVWDTMLIGHVLDSSLKDYSLKGMAKRELNIEYPTYDEIVGKKTAKQKNERMTLDKQPLDVVSLYNALDVFSTYKLYEKQERLINNAPV